MAKLRHRKEAMVRGQVDLDGLIKIVGAASAANNVVTMDKGGQGIASVARTNTGEYTITLKEAWVDSLGVTLTVQAATAIDLVPQVKSVDVKSAKTIVFTLNAGATPTDTANGVTHYVAFSIRLKNTVVNN